MNTIRLVLKSSIAIVAILFYHQAVGQNNWPALTPEMKPGTRWWWMGSAVDKDNLQYNLEEYARTGIGSVEITPIYGVQGNDKNDIPYLSDKWMKMYSFTTQVNNRVGMRTDMNTGTGWPFGGPEVTIEDAASKLIIREFEVVGGTTFMEKMVASEKDQQQAVLQRVMAFNGKKTLNLTAFVSSDKQLVWKAPAGKWRLIAAFNGKTFQKVKRAAPGAEGYVMDHFSASAVKNYLSKFDAAFSKSGATYPTNFFNDSYEVYGADWTVDFFEQFEKRRGYKLENLLPDFLSSVKDARSERTARIIADYRETIADMLRENFTAQWTGWANSHGSKTRNQAHGSPGNLIDLYATVDIPEIEGFGLSDFGIKGLRKDSLTRKNDSDLSMLKYAASAAHISGKQLVSSETFTWLTEHFRTSLSQCKPDLDLMFVAGVNHMYFHGTTYSPREAAWPGWKFYASMDMSPTNSIWRDAPALMKYITRAQSFLQMGNPDNDFLVYLPVYDVWHAQGGRYFLFSIHNMEKLMPDFIHAVHAIYKQGYDLDYISDSFILSATCVNGKIVTKGGTSYKALVLPSVKRLPVNVLRHIKLLVAQGAKVVFLGNYPEDVPGFRQYEKRKMELKFHLKDFTLEKNLARATVTNFKKGKVISGTDYKSTLDAVGVKAEEMVVKQDLHMIRRVNDEGYHYFISALHEQDTDGWINLSVDAKSALFFDPMTGNIGKAQLRKFNGQTQVWLQLKSGESLILKTFTNSDVQHSPWTYLKEKVEETEFTNTWKLHFINSEPAIKDTFTIQQLKSWTDLPHDLLKINRGTGVYTSSFTVYSIDKENEYLLKLGDVRESARVYINDKEAGIVWAAPFECRISDYLKVGENTIRIEVTNLPANSIADYDKRNVNWRIFKEINFVDRAYKVSGYGHWKPMESGLCSPLKIEVYKKISG